MIKDILSDKEDMKRQTRQIYAKGNMLNKFDICTPQVKCFLFKTFIKNF